MLERRLQIRAHLLADTTAYARGPYCSVITLIAQGQTRGGSEREDQNLVYGIYHTEVKIANELRSPC
jgi:hypothetical protein